MSLSQLPNEILLKIFQYLPVNNINIQTLLDVSLCSQKLHTAVEPVLYSTFRETSPTSLLCFLRTILQSPRLAQYVKKYHGHDTRTFWTPTTLELPSTAREMTQNISDNEVKGLLYEAMKSAGLGMELTDLWSENTENKVTGDWDAATAIALSRLPRLETFNVSYSQSRIWTYYEELEVRVPIHDAFALPWINRFLNGGKLKDLKPGGEPILKTMMEIASYWLLSDEPVLPKTTFTLYFKNNKFKKLKGKNVATSIWDFDILDNPVLSDIVDLELSQCAQQVIVYSKFYSRFPRLERLCIGYPDGRQLSVIDLLPALKHLEHCLKDLTLLGWSTHPVKLKHPDESLIRFEALETLSITVQYLQLYCVRSNPPRPDYGLEMWQEPSPEWPLPPKAPLQEVLPINLKNLSLYRCDEKIVGEAQDLVRLTAEGTRKLETLYLGFLFAGLLDKVEAELEDLRRECEEAGIKLTVGWMYPLQRDVPRF